MRLLRLMLPAWLYAADKGHRLRRLVNDKVNMMKISARIIELTDEPPARVVREIIRADNDASTCEGYRSYRAEKMSLYP